MYLTQIAVKTPTSPSAKFALAAQMNRARQKYGDPENEQNVHRMICDMAGGVKRKNENLLYKKSDLNVREFIIQSDSPLDREVVDQLGYTIIAEQQMDGMLSSLRDGMFISVVGKYAPTVTILGKKRSIAEKEDRVNWIVRRFADSGIEVLSTMNEEGDTVPAVEEHTPDHIVFSHKKSLDRSESTFINGYGYRIAAKISDAEKARTMIHEGLGRGKAYGCGMTVIRPVC